LVRARRSPIEGAANLRAVTRILVILAGYLCALVAAVLAIGAMFALLAALSPEPGSWAVIGVSPVLMVSSPVIGISMVAFTAVVTALPAFVLVVLCEIFGWRAAGLYLGFGAVAGAVGYYTFSFRVIDGIGATAAIEMAAFAAAGALAGLVYWTIAGRRAGRQPTPTPAPPPSGRGSAG
jgi:hypothetical protein